LNRRSRLLKEYPSVAVPARIAGLGTAVPAGRVSQADMLSRSTRYAGDDRRRARRLRVLFDRSEIDTRHSVVSLDDLDEWSRPTSGDKSSAGATTATRMQCYARCAPPLAAQAARNALDDAGLATDCVTHLVTVSCTGFDAPGIDLKLITSLGLKPGVQRVHVGYMGCHGAINGLRVARGLLAAEPGSRVLLVAVELCSLHFRFDWDEEGVIGNALFADGAAALVLDDRVGDLAGGWTLQDTGSCVLPDSAAAMAWTIGDHGFEMRLTSQVPATIEQHLRPWIQAWLDRQHLRLEDVQNWIVHPGGPRVIDAVQTSLKLPAAALSDSRSVLREFGNMSSPTVLFILDRLRRRGAECPCVMLAFGPGLAAETALLGRPTL
jgi:predicted naringenin-chalcone synthase